MNQFLKTHPLCFLWLRWRMTNQRHKVTQVHDLTGLGVRSTKSLSWLQVRIRGPQAAFPPDALGEDPLPYLSQRLEAPHSLAPGSVCKANDVGQTPAFLWPLLVLCCYRLPFVRTSCSHRDHLGCPQYSPHCKVISVWFSPVILIPFCHVT